MNKYYLHNGSENIGPFDLEELKAKKITKETPVWCEGMDDWTTAGAVEELKSILVSTPPPIKKVVDDPKSNSESTKSTEPKKVIENITTPKKANWFWRLLKAIVITLALFAIIMAIADHYSQKSKSAPTYEESVMTIAETEAAYPTNYLEAGGTYRENFLGDKLKIDGYIQNNATVTTYKDVVIEVTYYSKTDTNMGTENFTIYEFFPPTSKKPFNLKIKNYSNISKIGWKVINATVK